jgi:hypothetical protein
VPLGSEDVVQRAVAVTGPRGVLAEGGYGPLLADPAGLLALPDGFSYRIVSRGAGAGRAGAVPGWRAHAAAVVDPGRGHHYLTEGGDGPLRRRTASGGLQGVRCFDSGGRFVADLAHCTGTGAVLGVDWLDLVGEGTGAAAREPVAVAVVTRMRAPVVMWWGAGGVYLGLPSSSYGEDEGRGAVWFYSPSRRTMTLKALLGGGCAAGEGPAAVPGGLIVSEDGAGRSHLFGVLADGRTCPLARVDCDLGSGRRRRHAAFAGAAFSADGRTLFASLQEPAITLAITGPWDVGP